MTNRRVAAVLGIGTAAALAVYGLRARRDESPAQATRAPTTQADPIELRESVREVLERNCGDCHTKASGKALPRALRVYDLGDADFAGRMSAAQLREMQRRLHEPVAPALEGDGRPVVVSPAELDRVRAWVELEVTRRD